MNGWYIVMIGFISLLVVIWFTVIHIRVEYNRVHEDDELLLEFSVWRFLRYKKNIPLLDLKGEGLQYTETSKTEAGESVQEKKNKKRLFTTTGYL